MDNRHVTHLLTRYVNGTLRPRQRTQVINHVRVCESCRAALAREERVASDISHELPRTAAPRATQLAGVWADVLGELNTSRRRPRLDLPALISGVSVLVAVGLMLVLALPLLAEGSVRVEAAPQQARPISTASPTPGVTETNEARYALAVDRLLPQATIAFVIEGGVGGVAVTPAPMPQVTVSPEAMQGGGRW